MRVTSQLTPRSANKRFLNMTLTQSQTSSYKRTPANRSCIASNPENRDQSLAYFTKSLVSMSRTSRKDARSTTVGLMNHSAVFSTSLSLKKSHGRGLSQSFQKGISLTQPKCSLKTSCLDVDIDKEQTRFNYLRVVSRLPYARAQQKMPINI